MTWYEKLDAEVARTLPELELRKDEPLARHSSFRVGGPARRMAFPNSEAQLCALLELAKASETQIFVLGRGSNILVADEGLDALVIATQGLCAVERTGEDTLRAEAGLSLTQLALFAAGQGLSGLEFAHGIPGSLGGGIYMNAGAYEESLQQVLTSITVWSSHGIRTVPVEEAQLSYRHSIFMEQEAVILSASLRLRQGEETSIRARMGELMQKRKSSQPLEFPSAGSTFKRPVGHFAGRLIEQSGLKGYQIGGAQVSEKHAGFLINRGDATCDDILRLIAYVQEEVLRQHGVQLEPEVQILRTV